MNDLCDATAEMPLIQSEIQLKGKILEKFKFFRSFRSVSNRDVGSIIKRYSPAFKHKRISIHRDTGTQERKSTCLQDVCIHNDSLIKMEISIESI